MPAYLPLGVWMNEHLRPLVLVQLSKRLHLVCVHEHDARVRSIIVLLGKRELALDDAVEADALEGGRVHGGGDWREWRSCA